jgi:hypothetical protein
MEPSGHQPRQQEPSGRQECGRAFAARGQTHTCAALGDLELLRKAREVGEQHNVGGRHTGW